MCSTPTRTAAADENLGMLLSLVKSELVRALEKELVAKGIELRFSQFQALRRLSLIGPMSAGELARSLNHDCGGMTRLLDQLAAKGFLCRKPNPQDRRALRIELTAAGEAICRQLTICSNHVTAAAQQALTADERGQLNDYLQRILRTLRDPD